MRVHRLFLLACLAVAGGLAGCRTLLPPDPRISLEPALKQRVQVTQLIVRRNEANLLEIQATLQNLGYRTLPLESRVDWFDGQGLKQESLTGAWRSFSVSGHAEYHLKVTAPNEQTTDFRAYIRQPRRN